MGKNFNRLLIMLLITNIIISLSMLWSIMRNFSEYSLTINSDNRQRVINLLMEDNFKVNETQNLTKIKFKQGLGEKDFFLYYDDGSIDTTIRRTSYELTEYILNMGKKVTFYQEIIYYVSIITFFLIVILIIINKFIIKYKINVNCSKKINNDIRDS